MSSFLQQLTSPVLLEAQECGPLSAEPGHGASHGATASVGTPWFWPLVALGLVVLAAVAGAWLLRRSRRSGGRGVVLPRWAAAGLLTAFLLALPLLSLHASHHWGEGAGAQCALAGIAHGVASGIVTAVPVLAAPIGAILLLVTVLLGQTYRVAPQPIARGPPDFLSTL